MEIEGAKYIAPLSYAHFAISNSSWTFPGVNIAQTLTLIKDNIGADYQLNISSILYEQ